MFAFKPRRSWSIFVRQLGIKVVHVLVLLSLLVSSCQWRPGSQPSENELSQKGIAGVLYSSKTKEIPVFKRPEPKVSERPEEVKQEQVERIVENLPIQFIENVGQFDERSIFQAQVGRQTTFFAKDAIWLTVLEDPTIQEPENPETLGLFPDERFLSLENRKIKGVNLKLTFVGSNTEMNLSGINPNDTNVSFLQGSGSGSSSFVDVPVWGGIRYENLYAGYDLEMSGEEGNFSWNFLKNDIAGSVLGEVRLKVEGAQSLVMQKDGVLITTNVAHLLLPVPLYNNVIPQNVYIEGDEIVLPYSQSASIGSSHLASLHSTNETNNFREMPNLNGLYSGYMSFLVAVGDDSVHDVAVNSAGNAYITGETPGGFDFPTVVGSYDTEPNGNFDCFVSMLLPNGTGMVYSTFLGGSNRDHCSKIALDQEGSAYITGITDSADFPTTAGDSYGGEGDAFVAKLNPDGTSLLYSMYIGQDSVDVGRGITVDVNENAYVTGKIRDASSNLDDVFAAKVDLDGSQLDYLYIFGGSNNDIGYAIEVDQEGYAYIAGGTTSVDFSATASSYDGVRDGESDGFVAKLNPMGDELVAWTYLGGNGSESIRDIAQDTNGNTFFGWNYIFDFISDIVQCIRCKQ